jgi:hypothetical protein
MAAPRGLLLAMPGTVLDFDDLPPGAEVSIGQRVRHAGRMWTVHALPHCWEDVPVLLRIDGKERWCQACGRVGLTESLLPARGDD